MADFQVTDDFVKQFKALGQQLADNVSDNEQIWSEFNADPLAVINRINPGIMDRFKPSSVDPDEFEHHFGGNLGHLGGFTGNRPTIDFLAKVSALDAGNRLECMGCKLGVGAAIAFLLTAVGAASLASACVLLLVKWGLTEALAGTVVTGAGIASIPELTQMACEALACCEASVSA